MKKNIIFLFLLLSITVYSQSQDSFEKFDQEINYNLFSGNWQKADSLVNEKLGEQPNSLKYNFLKAYCAFHTRYLGNNQPFSREETIRRVKKYAWDAIQIGEESEENLENNFFLGSAYAYLSRVNVMNQELWEGYWNASKAEDYLEEVIDQNPEFYDAYLNLGVNEYFPAVRVTGFQSVLAWLGGMSGDRDLGISYIEKVSDKGELYKDEATFILGLLQSYSENNLIVGYEYWKILSDKYPGNVFFNAQTNRTYIAKLVDEKGVDFLNSEFDQLDSLYGINNPNVLNTLGYFLVNQERYDEAIVVFKVNIKKYPDVANGYDSIAECYMTMGDNENAIKYYKIAYDKLPADSTITDDFKQRLEEGIINKLEELNSPLNI